MNAQAHPVATPRPRCPQGRSLEPLEPRLLLSSSTPFELAILPTENGGDGLAGVMFYNGSGWIGQVSSAGDLNGDGIDDLVIGYPGQDDSKLQVVFGRAGGYPGNLNLSTLKLDGTNGFTLKSDRYFDLAGGSISPLGDFNGDGIDDLLIGAQGDADSIRDDFYDVVDWDTPTPGRAYVVLGKRGGFNAVIDLTKVDGDNLLQFIPGWGYTFVYAVNGIGDVNGDGLNDFAVASGHGQVSTGQSLSVVYGKTGTLPASLYGSDLDGTNGFVVTDSSDIHAFASMGIGNGAGDVNGDGYDDYVYRPTGADQIYVIYGNPTGGPASWDVSEIDGENGFAITGFSEDAVKSSGFAGDINGDGIDDLIVGVPSAGVMGAENPGLAYVIFGKRQGFGAAFELSSLNGDNGFAVLGIDENAQTGYAVTGVGDVNNDGLDDVLIGAPGTATHGNQHAGAAYLLYGQDNGFNAVFDLEQLNDQEGFAIHGIREDEQAGIRVSSAGDFNADGRPDLIIRATGGLNSTDRREVYVIWGGQPIEPNPGIGTEGPDVLTGTTRGDLLIGGQGDDLLIGRGGTDVLYGDAGNDTLTVSDLNFTGIEGGDGFDTLRLDTAGAYLSLLGAHSGQITGVEVIDITGSGGNTLILDKKSLDEVTLSNSWPPSLTIRGDADDALYIGSGWSLVESEVIGSDTYNIYENDDSSVAIKVQNTIQVLPAAPPTTDGDLTGDGKADIVWRDSRTGQNILWRLDGTALDIESTLRRLPNTDWKLVGTGDFTGDGKNDFLWRNTKDGRNRVWEMDGADFVQRIDIKTLNSQDWQVAGVGDFTGDGRDDILWRNTRNGRNVAWNMFGTAFIESVSLKTLKNQDWQAAAVGDLTGDGKDDILWRNQSTGQNSVWKMNGTLLESTHKIKRVKNPAWRIAGIADYTGDGTSDILWRHTSTGANSVWQMNGTRFVNGISLPALTDPDQQPASPLLGLWEV